MVSYYRSLSIIVAILRLPFNKHEESHLDLLPPKNAIRIQGLRNYTNPATDRLAVCRTEGQVSTSLPLRIRPAI